MNKIIEIIRYRFNIIQLLNYLKFKFSKKTLKLKYRPVWLLLYVSDVCNLRCKMCPHHADAKNNFKFIKELDGKFITKELVKKIYLKFPESLFVMLGGVGEPLLNPDFKDIVDLSSKHKKKINLITNGILLNKEMAELLVKSKNFNQISVSLNTSSKEFYKETCNVPEHVFDQVVDNIKNLVALKKQYKSNVEIVVSAVASKRFMENITSFLEFADTLGVDRIDIHNYIDFEINDDLMPDYSELAEVKAFVLDNIKTKTNPPVLMNKDTYHKKCDWHFRNLAIDAYGNIAGCGRVITPNPTYGNIDDQEDVWNNSYMQEMRAKCLSVDDPVTKYCENCIENHQEAGNE